MKQLEFDFSDVEEPTTPDGRPPRSLCTFVGTTSVDLSLDPREFRGKSVPSITEEIKAVLRSIASNVDFFEQDVVEAAHALCRD